MELECARGRYDMTVPEKYDSPFFTFETSYGPMGLLILSDDEGIDDGKVVTTIQVWAEDFSVSGKVYSGNIVFGVHPSTARYMDKEGAYHVEGIEVKDAKNNPAPAGVQAKFEEVAAICFTQASRVQGILLQSLLHRRFVTTMRQKKELDEIVPRVQSLKASIDAAKVELKRIGELIEKKTAAPAPVPDPPAEPARRVTRK